MMKIYSISFTPNGDKLNLFLSEKLNTIATYRDNRNTTLHLWTKEAFEKGDAIIFIGAMGIAVRSISPFLERKNLDPAVIVIDEKGSNVIPVLSGHIGGANRLAIEISNIIGGTPIITTATDINNLWAVDSWAVENGFFINNIENIKYISSAILENKNIGLISHINIDKKQFPKNAIWNDKSLDVGVLISPYLEKPFKKTLNIVPKNVVLGVGSKKNADEHALIELFEKIISENNICRNSVSHIATIDLKKNEKAVLKLCEYLSVELKTYNAEQLNALEGKFTGSDFVNTTVGTDNVCERSAVLSSDKGSLMIKKTALNGVTMAMALKEGNIK